MNREDTEALYRVDDLKPSCAESIPRWQDTDTEAEFRDVFLRHYPAVVSVLLRLTGDRSRAEELANEVFWRFSRKGAVSLVNDNVGAWLYRTAVRAGIDALRGSTKRSQYEHAAAVNEQTKATPNGPLETLLREEECRKVRGALAAMKPARAQILTMRSSGASYREMADVLRVPVGNIGTLLNRAEAEFKKRYLRFKLKEKK